MKQFLLLTLCIPVPLVLAACGATGAPATESTAGVARTGVANRPITPNPGTPNVGIVIFDGLFVTELTAPFDIYKHAGDALDVFTVAETMDPIETHYGLAMVPDYTFETCPTIDVLVVPSGNQSVDTDLENEELIGFVRSRASEAEWVTSHCWGSFSLAQAGVLDGRACMTFPTSIDQLEARFPGVNTRKGARFVVDGNIVTSGGGLAAYEAAVFVVEQMLGEEVAQSIADGLVFAPQNRTYSRAPRAAGGE